MKYRKHLDKALGDDPIDDLIKPAFKEFNRYRAAVCYFDPKTFWHLKTLFLDFVKRNEGECLIQMLISPSIINNDLLLKSFDDLEDTVNKNIDSFRTELDGLDKDEDEQTTQLLAWMIADNILDIRIALPRNRGLYHYKKGIFSNTLEDYHLYHDGSMNWTMPGMRGVDESESNWETINIYYDKENEEDREIVQKQISLFESHFDLEDNKQVVTYKLPNSSIKKLIEQISYSERPYDEGFVADKVRNFLKNQGVAFIDEVIVEEVKVKKSEPALPGDVKPRAYQTEAVEELRKNNYRGLLEMATASGKTWVSLFCALDLYQELKKEEQKLLIVVTCHNLDMVRQWIGDLKKFGFEILEFTSRSRNTTTDLNNRILDFLADTGNSSLAIVTTKPSASHEEKFLGEWIMENIKDRARILIISDEAHHDAADTWKLSLRDEFEYRIALTATPKRLADPEGDQIISDYFDGAHFIYDMEEAITGKKYGEPSLCPYYYHPKYDEIDNYIADDSNDDFLISDRSEGLYRLLEEDLKALQGDHGYTILYSAPRKTYGNIEEKMRDQIKTRLMAACTNVSSNIRYANIDSEVSPSDREGYIKGFTKGDYDVIIAIKCLDEGINIPDIKRAFILYSTTNPREYIQRRGRILRKSDNKNHADIFDYIVIPKKKPYLSGEKNKIKQSLIHEKNKIEEYSRYSDNKNTSTEILEVLEDLIEYLQA